MQASRKAQLRTLLAALLLTTPALADDWYPSRHGADDTLGAINFLSPEIVVEAARLVTTGKTYALGVPTGPNSPAYGPRRYAMTVLQLDDGLGTPMASNRITSNDDLLQTWMGIGSQIDGLGHLGIDHRYYNGKHASEFVTVTGLTTFSIDRLPPIVSRGVLLNMAAHFNQPVLDAGTVFNSDDIKAAASAQNVRLKQGDVVLFHTGWLSIADSDPARFMAGEPGLGEDGARYLGELGVVAVGADTWGLDALPGDKADELFPAHQELLARQGVYVLENMDTRALVADQVQEFLFVLGQPRFVGAVQAIINPVAIR
ncbi:MAG: cyclase family protein [Halieaceae bacterium]|uniref:cyclase family protein n=1 Tax=Haliea alexandrii TaxID=2448162 RepID=UPI000F0B0A4A|nr:cyclase family protein [Haliea alexandrii]MCR9185130.1 cyclase family protein [Halieaceae bacterium]